MGAAVHDTGLRPPIHGATEKPVLAATYVLPLATTDDDIDELARYLHDLVDVVDQVIVVDGSPEDHLLRHRAAFPPAVELCPPEERTPNGKVGGVLTGLARARHEKVVIADDDVRYRPDELLRVLTLLDQAEVVRPQNHFEPRPWHAVVDTSRTLLNRLAGGDWSGTLGVHRSAVERAGGYAGDVMFENLELVRAIRATGGREVVPLDLYVTRIPPSAHQFRTQQVRQAYDEQARPWRLLPILAIAPVLATALHRRAIARVGAGAAGLVLLAEAGRRRGGGRQHFSAVAPLIAPAWLVWRSLCTWAALGARARGGVRYRDQRIRRAARTSAWQSALGQARLRQRDR